MNLTTNLGQLENTELVRRLNETDLAYLIKHALIQETALASLLNQERTQPIEFRDLPLTGPTELALAA